MQIPMPHQVAAKSPAKVTDDIEDMQSANHQQHHLGTILKTLDCITISRLMQFTVTLTEHDKMR